MTVEELIDYLSNYCNPNATVMIASQPSWPLQHYLGDNPVEVEVYPEDCDHVEDCDDDECECDCGSHGCDVEPEHIVYLPEGDSPRSSPYLSGAARDELGWR